MKFIETLFQPGDGSAAGKSSAAAPRVNGQTGSSDSAGERIARNIEAAIAPLIKKEPATGKAALQIPLPASLTSERISQSITSALSRLMAG
jgi:hypothetical protein